MNEEMRPDENQGPPDEQAGMPADPDPLDDLGPDPEGGKVGRGNKGILIVFLVLLAIAAVVGVVYYFHRTDAKQWEERLETAAKAPTDAEFKTRLREIVSDLLEQDKRWQNDTMAQAAFELGQAGDEEAVPLLIRTVSWGDSAGVEAAMALARIGGEKAGQGTDAIYEQMKKSAELRKAKYAWALCMLDDDRGFPPLLEALGKRIVKENTIPDFDRDVIARVGTTEKLVELAEADDPMLRMYAAMELGFRTDKDPVPALLELVKDDNKEVARAAAVSLGRTTDERAGEALLAKMKSTPSLRSSILKAVSQSVGAPGLEAIYDSTSDPAVKYKIVGELKKLHDPRSTDLLLKILEEDFPGSADEEKRQADEIRNQALWTLEDLGDPRIAEQIYEKTQWQEATEEDIADSAIRYRENDMRRKIANGVVSWFGKVNPQGAADYLMKIYDANKPYSNTPESARRVKVDIGPLMDAMGRTGDERFCDIIEPFLEKDEGFYSQSASMALGRLDCPGIVDDFIDKMKMTKEERKEEKFATTIEGRDWQMEDRLQERRNSIIATRYLGDPKTAETLMEIVLDPADDPELRKEAATSLAYVADEEVMESIVEKISDKEVDIVVRAALMQGLWHNPSQKAVEASMAILEGEGDNTLVKPAAIAVGESGDESLGSRLNALLDGEDEHRQRAAVLAILLGAGNLEKLGRLIDILNGQEARLLLRQWYTSHPVYLTEDIFESGRIFQRLEVARKIMDRTEESGEPLLWPWKHLMERLEKGWDDSPGGLTALEVRELLSDAVRNDAEHRELAAKVLSGLNERGYLLALQSEEGPQSEVARDTLRIMNTKS